MSYFLTNIHVNKIFHLENFDIPLDNDNLKHLIITGKNGSGKTILVNAIVDFLDKIKNDVSLNFINLKKHKKNSILVLESIKDNDLGDTQIPELEQNVQLWETQINSFFGTIA